jgi:putative spermidine/putrescine transport system permease protein
MVFAPIGLVRTVPGLIAAHVLMTLPFVIRTMVATIHGIDATLEDAATILGAGRLRVFRHVILPLAAPGMISAASFAFIISFDEFSVSLFLVGTNVMTLPLEMYQRMQFIINPTIAAASVLLVAMTFAVVFVLDRAIGMERLFRWQ